MLLSLLSNQSAPTYTLPYLRVSGVWGQRLLWTRAGGVWKAETVRTWLKVSGTWK